MVVGAATGTTVTLFNQRETIGTLPFLFHVDEYHVIQKGTRSGNGQSLNYSSLTMWCCRYFLNCA